MDGYQYERKCANLLKEKGYINVEVTKGSGDQGIDVLCYKDGEKYGVQCKYYEGVVGNKAVQEAFAGAAFYNCNKAMVITNSILTKQAHILADKLSVEIWENVDAIYLQQHETKNSIEIDRISKAEYDKLSQSEKNAYEIKIIESLLKKEFDEFHNKYPIDEIKDQEIKSFVDSIVEKANSIFVDTGKSIASEHIDVKSISKDGKINLTTDYKNRIRQHIKDFGVKIKLSFDQINKYAEEYVLGPFSVQSARELIQAMNSVIIIGGSLKIHIGSYLAGTLNPFDPLFEKDSEYNARVSFTRYSDVCANPYALVPYINGNLAPGVDRNEEIKWYLYSPDLKNHMKLEVAHFSWPEKYKRTLIEWNEFQKNLPIDPHEEMLTLEMKEKKSLEDKIDDEMRIKRFLNDKIKNANIIVEQHFKKMKEMEDKDERIKKESDEIINRIQRNLSEQENELNDTFEKLKNDLVLLEKEKEMIQAEYNSANLFKLRRKMSLNNEVKKIDDRIAILKNEINIYPLEIQKLQNKHAEEIKSVKENTENQLYENRKVKKEMINQYYSAQEDLKKLPQELASLNETIKHDERDLDNFHKLFVINHYREKYKEQLVLESL